MAQIRSKPFGVTKEGGRRTTVRRIALPSPAAAVRAAAVREGSGVPLRRPGDPALRA